MRKIPPGSKILVTGIDTPLAVLDHIGDKIYAVNTSDMARGVFVVNERTLITVVGETKNPVIQGLISDMANSERESAEQLYAGILQLALELRREIHG